jgi:predicted nucleotidyltransferase
MHRTSLGIALNSELLESVARGSAVVASPVADALVAALSDELGNDLVGVIFYGSRLNRTAGSRSDWDFFVVVESYRAIRRGWLDARLNAVLPPNVYRREVELGDGSMAPCKLSIVSAADVDRYTSAFAPDSYLFGRFSKRVALVFARDDLARRQIVDALARSVALCAAWTLVGAEQGLRVETLAQASVAFSYGCEERVEGPSRAQKLFVTDAEYFREVYEHAIAAQVSTGRVQLDPTGLVHRSRSDVERRAERAALATFVRRSRRRARLRWLKNIWTFEGWDDYMLAKIERHQEVPISLSERERRHPLLAALRHYVRLRREGRISGTSHDSAIGDSGGQHERNS